MANMSYCRFQNTQLDLRDCVDEMEQHEFFEDMELSKDETYAMMQMFKLCKRFVKAYEELTFSDDKLEVG